MRLLTGVVLAVALLIGSALVGGIVASRWPAVNVPVTAVGDTQRGAILFQVHCAKCHGTEGRGDAEGTEKMQPPPRDFHSRPWKFSPTSEAIEQVIRRGSPGTAMPAFASLTEEEVASLTSEVLTMSAPEAADHPPEVDLFRTAGFSRLKVERSAPALKLVDAKGSTLSLADLHGRVVLLNFWGTSCQHCLSRMPELAELQAKYAEQPLAVINICADEEDATAAQAMLPDGAVAPLNTYVDSGGLATAQYEVSLLPTIWLIDREGQLLAKAQGARDWSDPTLYKLLDHCLSP